MNTNSSYTEASEYVISIFPDGTSITREEKIMGGENGIKPIPMGSVLSNSHMVSFDDKIIGNIR